MNSQVGIWIDHKQAFIAFAGEEAHAHPSGMEGHVRFSAHSDDGATEDRRERQFAAAGARVAKSGRTARPRL